MRLSSLPNNRRAGRLTATKVERTARHGGIEAALSITAVSQKCWRRSRKIWRSTPGSDYSSAANRPFAAKPIEYDAFQAISNEEKKWGRFQPDAARQLQFNACFAARTSRARQMRIADQPHEPV